MRYQFICIKEIWENNQKKISQVYKMEHARLRIFVKLDCMATLMAAWKTSRKPLPVMAEHS